VYYPVGVGKLSLLDTCEIVGALSGVAEDSSLLGCNSALLGE